MAKRAKTLWVEPKVEQKPEVIVLDLSKVAINAVSQMSDYWELFVTITDKLPDEIVLNENQYYWYVSRLQDYAKLLGIEYSQREPDFKGLKIRIKR